MITIINFSARNNGNCHYIAEVLRNLYGNNLISFYEMSSLKISSCGNCEYQCMQDRLSCPFIKDSVFDIYKNILDSDYVYFIIPNYCNFPCSQYFIFNERSLCFFQKKEELLEKYINTKKKFIVISNTEEDFFRTILKDQVPEGKEVDLLVLSQKKYGLNSIDANLMSNEECKNEVIKFAKNK